MKCFDGHCSNTNCTNYNVGFEIDEENKFCPKCGALLQADNDDTPTSDLYDVLLRYEGAISEVEREGNESEEATTELREARAALMDVLRKAQAVGA